MIGTVVLCITAGFVDGASQIDDLLQKLTSKTLDPRTLSLLEAQPQDSRTLPALRSAFDSSTDKHDKQLLAVTLIHLGDRSDVYFNFLADFAKEAVNDRAPNFESYDQQGRPIRGQFSAEYLNWCAANGKDPKALAGVLFGAFPEDVHQLARALDPRALGIFRAGLESPNLSVVTNCVQGLGRLNDTASIAMIAKAAQRFPASTRSAISINLPWFSSPEALRLMEQLTPDVSQRQYYIGLVNDIRLAEFDTIQKRQGSKQ